MLTRTRRFAAANERKQGPTYLVWIVPVFAAWSLIPGLHPVALMGLICVSLFLLIKTHSLLLFRCGQDSQLSTFDLLAWFFAWPGLNPRHFFRRSTGTTLVPVALVVAIVEVLAGAAILLFLAPKWRDSNPMLSGWCALSGIALMLHFGLFGMLACTWNGAHRPVRPIMNAPLAATSIADFWGNRWNLAFRDYAHQTIFSPLTRRFNAITGTLLGFLFSGVVHDLAISVPARGGYGLPTIYFLLQGVGIMAERVVNKHVVRIRGNLLGWIWSVIWILLPAPLLLFHPPFIRQIVLPIVDALATH